MVFTKKATKSPSVMVETKKMSAKDTCGVGGNCCTRIKQHIVVALVVINTILLFGIFLNQKKIESERVGGRDNYKMIKQIYKSPAFEAQQKQQIQQALQMYQGGAAGQALPTAPTIK